MSDHDLPPPDPRDAVEPPDDDVLAAEFVLGVLSAQRRAAVEARAESDPQFARRISQWEGRFSPWLANVPAVEVPAHLWTQVRTRLGWDTAEPARTGLWQSIAFWRAATVLASIAALFAIWLARAPVALPPVAAIPPQAAEPAAKVVTTLSHDDGSAAWLASVDPARGTVLMVPVPHAADPQGRVPELWLIPPGKAPRSLGLVSILKAHTVTVPQDVLTALAAGSVLAISLEPPGGAPAGAPTGPIIAKGPIQI
jgi:anti-sigma-K factor RskA